MKYPFIWAILLVAGGFAMGYFVGYRDAQQRAEKREKPLPEQAQTAGNSAKKPASTHNLPEPPGTSGEDYRRYISVVLSWGQEGVSGTITNHGDQLVSRIELTFYWVDKLNRWTSVGVHSDDTGLKPRESRHFSSLFTLPKSVRSAEGHYNYVLTKLEIASTPSSPPG